LSIDREAIRRNLVDVCGDSPKKRDILKAVRKSKSYKEVANEIKANATYCSSALNEMAILGLVEPGEGNGFYRQTSIVKTMDIDSEIRKAGRKVPTSAPEDSSSIRIVKSFDIEGSLDVLDVDREIVRDCFPLRKPFRTHAGEAYLTLENVMKRELALPDTVFGVDVVDAANAKGVFNRTVPSETQGLILLYKSAFLWYRNIYHHKKDDVSKEEALKVIFHADYLIKLFRKQKELNGAKLIGESSR
jgi:hypothetical protein